MKSMLCCLLSFLLMMSFGTAANTTMKKTQEYTTAYLIKFYNDINSTTTEYINDDSVYYIRNKDNGKYMCVDGNDIVWSENSTNSCKFKFEVYEDYFLIRPYNSTSKYLSVFDNITVSNSPVNTSGNQFRIINCEDGYYRIHCAGNATNSNDNERFKYPIYGGSKPTIRAFLVFNPNDEAYLWQISKCN